jgi:septal ring-binding cell division protein DamX
MRAIKRSLDGDDCWQLVWGSYPSSDEAEEAIEKIPAQLLQEGFDPRPILLSEGDETRESGG